MVTTLLFLLRSTRILFARHRGPALCALVGGVLALTGSMDAQQSLFEFVQISDSQPQTSSENQRFVDVLSTIAAAGQSGALLPRSVDLVLFAGDLTWNNSSSEFVAVKSKLDAWLTAKGIPYRAVPGNHDVDGSDTSMYEQYIASSAVWDIGSASYTGHNGLGRTTGWQGLRFIGFDNSNPDYNQISSADVSSIQTRVNAAAAAHENVFLLCHHPHDGSGRMPLANVLPNPAIVGYLRGHSGSPRVKKGLSGISNPNVWDVNTNAIVEDRDLVYFEVFPTELRAYVVILDNNPSSLPAPQILPLVYPLTTSGGGSVPVADFSASPRSGSAPLSVTFTDLSTNSPTGWLWDFGDGTTSTLKNPVHSYTQTGSRTVRLEARNAAGTGVLTRTDYIVVGGSAPVADFSASPRSGSAPLSVAFTDLSTNSPTSWLWDFGDGTTSTLKNPVHSYTQTGSRTVRLEARNAAGAGVRLRSDYVVVSGSSTTRTFLPVADTTASQANPNGNTGLNTQLQVKNQSGSSFQAFFKFDLTSLSGSVSSAKLRLFCTNPSNDGGQLYKLTSTSWTETGLTWNNKPALPSGSLRSLGSVPLNTWIELDVTSSVQNGLLALALANGSSDPAFYSSRQGSNPPQLVIQP